jgi:hypothetical protein
MIERERLMTYADALKGLAGQEEGSCTGESGGTGCQRKFSRQLEYWCETAQRHNAIIIQNNRMH